VETLIDELAAILEDAGVCSATVGKALLQVSAVSTNTGTDTFSVRLALSPPSNGAFTCDEMMAAIALRVVRALAQGEALSRCRGVAAYKTYGTLGFATLTTGGASMATTVSLPLLVILTVLAALRLR
jgi:hypothetical protein